MPLEILLGTLRSTLQWRWALSTRPSPLVFSRGATVRAESSHVEVKPSAQENSRPSQEQQAHSLRPWAIFEWLPDEGVWGPVAKHDSYVDVHDALRNMQSLTRRKNPPRLYRVVGFSRRDAVRGRIKDEDLVDQDGVSLHRPGGLTDRTSENNQLRLLDPIAPTASARTGWETIFRLLGNGHLDVQHVFVSLGYTVKDTRPRKGHLWVEGDTSELEGLVFEIMEKTRLRFRFTPYGGKATGHRPAWYSQQDAPLAACRSH
jgi:hypothetical protein